MGGVDGALDGVRGEHGAEAPPSLANFAGYVVWCAWLLLVSWLLVRPYGAQPASVSRG